MEQRPVIIRPALNTRIASRRLAPALDALEQRLLTLRFGDAAPAEPEMRPLPFPRDRASAPPRWRRGLGWAGAYGRGAFWVVIIAICASSVYVIFRGSGGATAPTPAAPEAAFAASAEGRGRLALPVTAGDLRVRVEVEPAARGEGAWFWCLGSERGLSPQQHICAAAGPGDPTSGAVTSGGVVHVAAAQADADSFFVQMYCPGGCRWRALAAPESLASPVALSSSRR
jgi:hypothetical protein